MQLDVLNMFVIQKYDVVGAILFYTQTSDIISYNVSSAIYCERRCILTFKMMLTCPNSYFETFCFTVRGKVKKSKLRSLRFDLIIFRLVYSVPCCLMVVL